MSLMKYHRVLGTMASWQLLISSTVFMKLYRWLRSSKLYPSPVIYHTNSIGSSILIFIQASGIPLTPAFYKTPFSFFFFR